MKLIIVLILDNNNHKNNIKYCFNLFVWKVSSALTFRTDSRTKIQYLLYLFEIPNWIHQKIPPKISDKTSHFHTYYFVIFWKVSSFFVFNLSTHFPHIINIKAKLKIAMSVRLLNKQFSQLTQFMSNGTMAQWQRHTEPARLPSFCIATNKKYTY